MPLEQFSFADRLQAVENRIDQALERARRERSDVKLVAVSKKFSADRVCEAYGAGLREFGENYVQEFVEKRPQLSGLAGATFHLIGHLQSNKARLACDIFDVIQTADSAKTILKVETALAQTGRHMEGFLEIKLSDEQSKTGAQPEQIPELLAAAERCRYFRVTGLMTVPPWSEDPEQSRPYFRRLAELARTHQLRELSMGMSGDLEVAIEEGATLVRIGTALFGPRPKSAKSPTPLAS